MISWRTRLLVLSVVLAGGGWIWMALTVRPWVRPQLGLLAVVFAVLMGAVHLHYRDRLTARLVTASVALGLVVHTACAALLVAIDRLMILGVVPTLASHWLHLLVGAVGIGGAFVSWTRARSAPDEAAPTITIQPESPPPELPELAIQPDWEAVQRGLIERGDSDRLRAIQALHRVESALEISPDHAHRVIRQEVLRLGSESDAQVRTAESDDVLSQTAALLEWGAQKLPELAELDVSDLMMGKAIADIRSSRDRITRVFVDHRELLAIHPIDRATAEEKCDERAAAARAALPLLRANGMRLSEDLIAAEPALAAFQSVTGFQVIELPGQGYVTFEGNGRREALQRAFGDDEGVLVEVRRFDFDDPARAHTMQRRVDRVRRWKQVVD